MPSVTITLSDTPTGGVAIHTEFKPSIGAPCSPAQSAALEVINRTKRDWGMKLPFLGELDIDAVHRSRDKVMAAAINALPPMQERGR